MKVIVCLDDCGGMMFNRRRQSRDRVLIDDIVKTVGEARLFIDGYSEALFAGKPIDVTVSDDMSSVAEKGDFCFVENSSVAALGCIDELIIYRWNREYPADMFFDIDIEKCGFKLKSTDEFAGYSHKKITKEIYKR